MGLRLPFSRFFFSIENQKSKIENHFLLTTAGGQTHTARRRLICALTLASAAGFGVETAQAIPSAPTGVVETGAPHARYALLESGNDGWRVTLRAVPYDWESAAQRAAREGRPDWAHTLRTGFVGLLEGQGA